MNKLQKTKISFIGLGNPMRGDDGVGWILTEQLKAKGYHCRQLRDDLTLLLNELQESENVIIVDAMEDSTKPVGMHSVFDLESLQETHYGSSTHSLSLKQTLEMAEVLGSLPKKIIIYAINGAQFSIGEKMSSDLNLSIHLKNLEDLCTKLA